MMPAISYILVIWTTVAALPSGGVYRDWRPIGEFQIENGRIGQDFRTAEQMCHDAAKQLNLKMENYRCVRSK